MYKSYHYDNMPRPIPPQHKEVEFVQKKEPHKEKNEGLLSNLQNDDIVLLIIIFILLMDDCEDKLLLAALGFIFFSGFGE